MYKQDVIARILKGDENAFEIMCKDCSPAIYKIAMESLNGDDALAKTVVKNTFITMHAEIRKIKEPKFFDEYAYKTTQNCIEKIIESKNKDLDKNNIIKKTLEQNKAMPELKPNINHQNKAIPELKPTQPQKPKSSSESKPKQNKPKTIKVIPEKPKTQENPVDEWEPILFEPDDGENDDEYSFSISMWPASPSENTKNQPALKQNKEIIQEKVFQANEIKKNAALDGPRRVKGPRKSERKRSFWSMTCMLIALLLLIVAVYILAKENLFFK